MQLIIYIEEELVAVTLNNGFLLQSFFFVKWVKKNIILYLILIF